MQLRDIDLFPRSLEFPLPRPCAFPSPVITLRAPFPHQLVLSRPRWSTLHPGQARSEPVPKLHLPTCLPGPFLLLTVGFSRKQTPRQSWENKGPTGQERKKDEVRLDGLSFRQWGPEPGEKDCFLERPRPRQRRLGPGTTTGLRAGRAGLGRGSEAGEGAVCCRLSSSPVR